MISFQGNLTENFVKTLQISVIANLQIPRFKIYYKSSYNHSDILRFEVWMDTGIRLVFILFKRFFNSVSITLVQRCK